MTEYSLLARVLTAIFYGVSSVLIVLVNKLMLTNYRFPSFLVVALGQMLATIVILRLAKLLNIVKFPSIDSSIPRKIFPLPLLYGINVVSGLGGTQMINLAMFTVLRRFSILITMVLEFYILRVVASREVRLSIALMIAGSIIAAFYDLSFDAYGYALVTINNLCTSAVGVYTKQKLDAKDLGKYGLMYYNCLFIIAPLSYLCYYTGDLETAILFMKSDKMTPAVWCCFITTCICGFILNYALVVCTQCNSALTTQCVGPIKNLLVTYLGMFSSGDFIFQWFNFIGINISVLGSILYTYVTFCAKPSPQTVLPSKCPEKKALV